MKRIKCPLCSTPSTATEWNNKTREYFDTGIAEPYIIISVIEAAIYVCPKCEEELGGEILEQNFID